MTFWQYGSAKLTLRLVQAFLEDESIAERAVQRVSGEARQSLFAPRAAMLLSVRSTRLRLRSRQIRRRGAAAQRGNLFRRLGLPDRESPESADQAVRCVTQQAPFATILN